MLQSSSVSSYKNLTVRISLFVGSVTYDLMHHQLYFTEPEPIKILLRIAVSTCQIKLSARTERVNIHYIIPGRIESPLGTII